MHKNPTKNTGKHYGGKAGKPPGRMENKAATVRRNGKPGKMIPKGRYRFK